MRENWQGCCWHCGQTLSSHDYSRESRCLQCAKASYACRNCQFYKPGASNDCSEPVAEYVANKENPNFCDYFSPTCRFKKEDSKESQLAAANALFGD